MPITEALPLADQPHLLQPNARREDMFGMPKQPITVPSTSDSPSSSLELPPIRLGLSSQNKNEIMQNATTNTVVIVTPAAVSSAETQDDNKTIVSITAQESSASQKRPLSPKPGTSKSHEMYYKKNRHFIVKEFFCDEEDDESTGEVVDLSQQTLNNSNKMDIDEHEEKASRKLEEYDSDNDDEPVRSPVHKKNRMDTDEETKTIIRSGKIGPDTSITPELSNEVTIENSSNDSQQQSSSSILTIQQTDPSANRPPIIVTRRNVADAIESVTANVLAKNKKQSLSECAATSETPLSFLPNSFVYDMAKGENYERDQQSSGSPGKSVIVRVGPSVSFSFNFSYLIFGYN